MAIKIYKGTTPGRRNMSGYSFEEITRDKPEKSLLTSKRSRAGRNNQGKITIRHQGSGHKKQYRIIDFKQRDKINIPCKVISIEYDPNRTAYIMLVNYADGEKRYHLAPSTIKVGAELIAKEKAKAQVGNRMALKNVPPGYFIHNVELQLGRGGQIIRSAGSKGKVVAVEGDNAQVEFPSGEIRLVDKNCFATIGTVSNIDHSNVSIGKAGRNRWKGKRPAVRGKAMNPIDHPHGGGEGNQSIGLKHPKTPWGMPALGFKTRKRKYSDRLIVKSRRLKKKSNLT
ncbi:50S ribosomal protein L2 [Patescibacteria group bacterium]|nr:50S ribosomal protein L2 [Patescibacteria group bacterium]MBU1703508.1 50S ribosomal protein L2 [Patescibacteria group bacterium]MBU1953415.1 50S ribosomal protein L2 [Patescibacteria group bacterium]